MTGCGSTSAEAGKSEGTELGARSRMSPLPILMEARAGLRVPDRSMATAEPSLISTGDHSMPASVVSCAGFSPETETRQRCRRSASFWFEEKRTVRRSAEREACSISKSPGALSGVGTSPCVEIE